MLQWKCFYGCLLCCVLFPLSARVTLAENGKTEYVIVTAENAAAAERNAAQELRDCLKKVTGADFRIVDQKQKRTSPGIFVGNTDFASAQGMKQDSFGPEEWSIRSVGKEIVITGGRPRGVLYGVYDFLERFAGCRWFSINMDYTPSMAVLEVPEEIRIQSNPAFRYRAIYFLVSNMPAKAFHHFTNHARMNSYGNLPEYGFSEMYGSPRGCHSYLDYSKDFPVEISWMGENGKRVQVRKQTDGQICYSHPEVRKRFIEKMKAYIKTDREEAAKKGTSYPVFYDMSANDCSVPCHCPDCAKLAEKYGISGMVIDFTNTVAKEIEKEYPDVLVMMFAYKESMIPPKDIRARDNVVVRLAFMDVEFAGGKNRDVMRPLGNPQNRWYVEQMDNWRKAAKNLAVWDYWKLYTEPFPCPKTPVSNLPELVRKYRDLGVVHLFVETEIASAERVIPDSFIDLRNYAGARLMVNPDLDMKSLVEDFMNGFYGKGAAPMKEYLSYLETRMKEEPLPLSYVHPAKRKFMDKDFFLTVDRLLSQAEKSAAGEPLPLANVEQERLILDIAYLNMLDKFPENPLKLSREQLEARIRKNLDAFGRKHFTESRWNQIKGSNFQRFLAPLYRPPLPEKFKDKTVIDMIWSDIGQAAPVEDADAAAGKALSVPMTHYSAKEPFHGREVEFGVYARDRKQHLLTRKVAKADLPQDEKYHFYYLGRSRILENTCLWVHWTWWIQIPLKMVYDPLNAEAVYDVYLSLKAQGPSYVKNSKQPDDLRVDRAIFVKVMNMENPLPAELQGKKAIEIPYSAFEYLVEKKIDEDAVEKMAVSPKGNDLHSKEPAFGLIDLKTKKRPFTTRIPAAEIAQDEKYHLYKLGRSKLTPDMRLWGHFTWHMSCPLGKCFDSMDPDAEYDVYVSLKLQGPAYVKDSKKENAFLVERIFLVK